MTMYELSCLFLELVRNFQDIKIHSALLDPKSRKQAVKGYAKTNIACHNTCKNICHILQFYWHVMSNVIGDGETEDLYLYSLQLI